MRVGRLIARLQATFPPLRRLSLARAIEWQARFLTPEGKRWAAWMLAQGEVDEAIVTRGPLRWALPVSIESSDVANHLFVEGNHQGGDVEAMWSWAEANGRTRGRTTVVDVGANLGTTTLPLLWSTSCRVLAIEPVPRTAALLRRNLELNGLSGRAIVVERAVADRPGPTRMIVPVTCLGAAEVDPGGSGLGSSGVVRDKAFFRRECETREVEACRLDGILAEASIRPDDVAFVWADVQGSEGAVVRTGAALWSLGVPLYAEIAPELIRRQERLEDFLGDVSRAFEGFIEEPRLLAEGPGARPRPMADFASFVAGLEAGGREGDVLLLPSARSPGE